MELAIHFPSALYRAATVWFACLEYGMYVDPSSPKTIAVNDVEFPEYSRLKVSSQALLFEVHGYRTSRPKTLVGFVGWLTSCIGLAMLSRKFAGQLSFLLKENSKLVGELASLHE